MKNELTDAVNRAIRPVADQLNDEKDDLHPIVKKTHSLMMKQKIMEAQKVN